MCAHCLKIPIHMEILVWYERLINLYRISYSHPHTQLVSRHPRYNLSCENLLLLLLLLLLWCK